MKKALKVAVIMCVVAVAFGTGVYERSNLKEISSEFSKYKNLLLDAGVKLYEITSGAFYTYTKGDIAVKIYEGTDRIFC